MNTEQVAQEVVKLIRAGKNGEVKDAFYADHIVSIEGNGDTLEGIDAIQKKNAEWGVQIAEVHSASCSDPLVAADHFSLHIKMDITYKNGYRGVRDEIAVYEVKDGKIAAEQFFFKS
ncbi:nuclear transport factor 2 family protein [Pedobacter sp. L105]|uniref:nuclear transport factor 2 family protein n=1 Tax=Pedobacter sp. L105 TaxID=1641871 RepID=UPI00131AF960|nr:nuclear transport factor 2 family protein [Pedobacter sp. L105]